MDAAVGRFGVDMTLQPLEIDPAVDRRELHFSARRHLHVIFDLKLAAVEQPATRPRRALYRS